MSDYASEMGCEYHFNWLGVEPTSCYKTWWSCSRWLENDPKSISKMFTLGDQISILLEVVGTTFFIQSGLRPCGSNCMWKQTHAFPSISSSKVGGALSKAPPTVELAVPLQCVKELLFFSMLRPFSSSLHSVIGSSLSFSLTPFTLAVPSLQTPAIFFLSTHFSPGSQCRGSSSEEGLDWIPYFDVSNCLLLF